MSHVTDIRCKIKDLNLLAEACDKLGLEFRRDKKTFNWWGRSVGDYNDKSFNVAEAGRCDHAIAIKGSPWLDEADKSEPYEVGVVENKDDPGTYTLRFDFFGGGNGLIELTGDKCANLLKRYKVEVAKSEAVAYTPQGWEITEQQQPNGDVQISLTRGVGVWN